MLHRFALAGLIIAGGTFGAGYVGSMLAAPARTTSTMQASEPIATPLAIPSAESKPANPLVEPGKVHWHATTEAALAAAKESNKPVLVFQMMGQLDHQFC